MGAQLLAQPVCTPWGNIKSIYVDGEEMKLETSLRSVNYDWASYSESEKYNWEGQQTYTVEGKTHAMSHFLLGTTIDYATKMTDTGKGKAKQEITLEAKEAHPQAGTYYCLEVPGEEFANGTLTFFNKDKVVATVELADAKKNDIGEMLRAKANRVEFKSDKRNYVLTSGEALDIFLRADYDANPEYLNDPWPEKKFAESDPIMTMPNYQVYFTLIKGNAQKGTSKKITFNLEVSGSIDLDPVIVSIDAENTGRAWDGISGNYRNQFPDKDPMVIDYCLDSLRVTWGRISMWWESWHPNENADPLENAKAGLMRSHVYEQMELAKMLHQRDIPIIVSVWGAPEWAVDLNNRPRKGVRLNEQKMTQICESIAKYLLFLKQEYGVEAELFSFNEPDCGVEVFQTAEEHAIFNKAIGAHLKASGLKTKLILGDTGHGTSVASRIVWPTINDSSIHQYIGAIAFHTYHGCNDHDLSEWARAAKAINVPLMVTEGGENSAAHRYPLVFLQPWFQLDEIDTYVRICNICEPATIMEWQLTSDYSVLKGQGLYGDEGPLRPTQRFWNLKQLGYTPAGSFWMPVKCSRYNVSCAAAGNISKGLYAVHLVNNGAKREIKIDGLPSAVKSLNIYVTDAERGMDKIGSIEVVDGNASFTADTQAYYSLFNF